MFEILLWAIERPKISKELYILVLYVLNATHLEIMLQEVHMQLMLVVLELELLNLFLNI